MSPERLAEIKRSTSVKDRVKYSVIFWGITIPASFYFIPATILAYLNPFWFRKTALYKLQCQIRSVHAWRWQFLQPIVDKYLMFDRIKNG